MKILIREGSAARNLDALKELYKTNPQDLMLCSDDLHPECNERHINKLISKLVSEGYDLFDVVRSATIKSGISLWAGGRTVEDWRSCRLIIVDDPGK